MDTDGRDKKHSFSQEYHSAFILDEAKLSRILNVIEERFKNLGCQPNFSYSVRFSKGTRTNLSSLEELLKLDNTVRNPINSLIVRAIGSGEEANNTRCYIRFTPPGFLEKNDKGNLGLSVEASDAKLASQIFAELEEQIQRTFFKDFKQFIGALGLIVLLLLCILLVLILLNGAQQFKDYINSTISLSDIRSDIRLDYEKFKQLSGQADIASSIDEKINFLFELRRQEVEKILEARKPFLEFADNINIPSLSVSTLLNLKTFLLLLPVLVVFACVGHIIFFCSPSAVFVWGDYKEHYNHLVSLRRTLWSTVLSATILGLIINLSASVLFPYIR